MREFWIKIGTQLKQKEKKKLIKGTMNFCTAYVVDPADVKIARQFGAKTIVSTQNGDIMLFKSIEKALTTTVNKRKCIITNIKSGKDEEKIIKAVEALVDYIIVKCENWKIIPLENLIASAYGKSKLLAFVSNQEEAKLALEVLEVGVDGVLIEIQEIQEIKKIYQASENVMSRVEEREKTQKIPLVLARITEIRQLSSGARTCIDTCELMKEGEGMLIGCSSSGLFLIQAETLENPFVATRPFRVNAGSIAQYLLTPEGKTRYLSELRIGDEVLIVERDGKKRKSNICRTKIEWRPLLLVEAEYNNKKIKTIVQNAETIRFVAKEGSKSVKELVKGDEVVVRIQEGGRHFGRLIKEERVIER